MPNEAKPDKPAERCPNGEVHECGNDGQHSTCSCVKCGALYPNRHDSAPEAPAPQVRRCIKCGVREDATVPHALCVGRTLTSSSHQFEAPAPQVEDWIRKAAKEVIDFVCDDACKSGDEISEVAAIIAKHCAKGAK